jgi:hypothetical protein
MSDRPLKRVCNDENENEYLVARRVARRFPVAHRFPPCAACCWVEVYDSDPGWGNTTAVRIAAGYISEAEDTLEQLCALLPLEEWADLFCMVPGRVHGGQVYFLGHALSDLSAGALRQSLDSEDARRHIYHNEQMALGKLMLVIVRRA